MSDTKVNLNIIPDDWFLEGLHDNRKPIIFVGDTYTHINWTCSLQHKNGGKLTSRSGITPQEALSNAVTSVKERFKV